MSGIKDQQNIEELRKRLYGRDFAEQATEARRPHLTKTTVDISRGWGNPRAVAGTSPVAETIPDPVETITETVEEQTTDGLELRPIEAPAKRRPYRLIVLIASVAVFVIAALVSSVYLFFGANQISGRNISIDVSAPFTMAAGEKLTMQVNIGNQNSVPIESATLIVNYPSGTKTADESTKDLFESRIPIEIIASGEARTVPVSAVIFGEENEEKEVKVAIEYRVAGSNSTFFKEATPSKIKINSSPVVIRVNAVEKVASGQEMEITLAVQSNASVVQRNVLIKANFPNSFTFLSSDPEPSYAQNEWLIKELPPEGVETITLRGRVSGVANETAELQFEAGTPRSDNQFMMGSVLAKAKTGYVIESAFLNVVVEINKDKDGSAVIEAGDTSSVIVFVTNTLEETIYDMRVEIEPKGNLIRDNLLDVPDGYYDTNTKTIRYEVSGMPNLAEVPPGETRQFYFLINPDEGQSTAAFDISTKVFARRVREASAAEDMVGTAVAEAKYSAKIQNRAELGYSNADFADEGPIPPVANETTTYTLTFEVEAGVNDATNAVMTTTLPQYVSWLDVYDGEGQVEFNPVAKQLRWTIGTMTAKQKEQLKVQVGLLPSVTQVGTTPTIVGSQEFRATDRFTGETLRVTNEALRTELSTEAGFPEGNGRVVAD